MLIVYHSDSQSGVAPMISFGPNSENFCQIFSIGFVTIVSISINRSLSTLGIIV